MSEKDNFGAFLVGFLVGGITGAVVSLLLAPQSGEETRTVIKEKAIELKDKTAATAEETYQKAEKLATDATEKSKSFIKTTADKAATTLKKKPVVLEEE
jgi:gas vesicle protein